MAAELTWRNETTVPSLCVKRVQQAHEPTLCYKRKSEAAHSTPYRPCSSSTRVELASSYIADVSQQRKAVTWAGLCASRRIC